MSAVRRFPEPPSIPPPTGASTHTLARMTDRPADSGECPRCTGLGPIPPRRGFTLAYLLRRYRLCPHLRRNRLDPTPHVAGYPRWEDIEGREPPANRLATPRGVRSDALPLPGDAVAATRAYGQ